MLRRGERDALRALADRLGVRCECLWCEAPWPTLQARVARRQAQARDASDATVAVLRRQRDFVELPADGEPVLRVDTRVSRRRLDAEVAALAAWLRRSR
jgi:predicted kinase